MKAKKEETKKKLPYEKPKLIIVDIAEGQQTMGVGCKLRTGGWAKQATPCYPGNRCSQQGS